MRPLFSAVLAALAGITCVFTRSDGIYSNAETARELVLLYKVYARGDCDGVRKRVSELELDRYPVEGGRYFFDLVVAHCLELQHADDAEDKAYAAIVSAVPRRAEGYAAALRLRDREFYSRLGTTREALREKKWREGRAKQAPKPIHRVVPIYPPLFRAALIDGWCIVEFSVTTDGSVVDPIVVASEPPFVFEPSALAAMRHWIYESSVATGKDERLRVRLDYKLDLP